MNLHEGLRIFRAGMERYGWFDRSPFLLGVSGGSDSTALLFLFSRTFPAEMLNVFHLNHGIRDTASRDSSFVEELCARLKVRFIRETRNVPSLALKGEGEEAAGRRIRYELYGRYAELLGCGAVALGHNRDDLAENTLMNIARGCGLRGVAGMPRERGLYIRPLLPFFREELRDILRDAGVGWVDDESNGWDCYQRNRVRNDIMPRIRSLMNPRVSDHLADLAEEALEWRALLAEESRTLFNSMVLTRFPCVSFRIKDLRALSSLRRRELIRFCGRRMRLKSLPRHRTEELDSLIVSSGRWLFQWGADIDVVARNGIFAILPASEKKVDRIELSADEKVRWGGWNVQIHSVNNEEASYPEDGELSFCCHADPDGIFILHKNDVKNGDIDSLFPIIEQSSYFKASRRQNKWEITQDSVKYKDVCRVVFTPRTGFWRDSVWN